MSQERSSGPDDPQKEAKEALKSGQDVRDKNPITKADIIKSALESGLRQVDILRWLQALQISQEKNHHTLGV